MNRTKKKKRTYYSREQKDSYLTLYRRWSGSLDSFCEYHTLSPATFKKWVTSSTAPKQLEFVELAPKSEHSDVEAHSNEQITISFPNGITVQLPLCCQEHTIVSICSTLGGF